MLPTLRASRFARACAATAALFCLGACSQASPPAADLSAPPDRPGDEQADGGAETALGATPESTPPEFAGVQHRLPRGKALENDPVLYEQVALTGCEATADGWRAVGSATNPGPDPIGFTVLVLFTDAHARVVDSASTTVDVPVGATKNWTATRAFETTPGTSCVVRAVRGD